MNVQPYVVHLPFNTQELPYRMDDSYLLIFFPLRTLFKFVRKFQEALSGPSVPALVEQGSSASLDSVDTNPEETPIHRVHRALKSTLPGKGRDLQVQVSNCHLLSQMCHLFLFSPRLISYCHVLYHNE